MPTGQKHLVPCRCVLPQFKRYYDPPRHKFIVFSVIDENDKVIPTTVKCNNCGLLHRITELTTSKILDKDDSSVLITINDVKTSIPEKLVAILETHDADLPTYQHVAFILENSLWGDVVILNKEGQPGARSVKYIKIMGQNLYKIDVFEEGEG